MIALQNLKELSYARVMYEEKRDYFLGLCLYLKEANPDLYPACLSTPRDTTWDTKNGLKSVYKHDEEKGTFVLYS
jgi:hypothetical protein